MKKVYIIALIAAVITGALLYVYLGNLEAESKVTISYDSVVVAAVDIPAYTQITPEMLTMQSIPQGYAHAKAAADISAVAGLTTEERILAGEQIIAQKLKTPGEASSGLSYAIPEGMRAVTLAVDSISGVAGLIRQGDYVDVIGHTATKYAQEGSPEQSPAETTLVVAQNVFVAVLGSELTQSVDESGSAVSTAYSYVTLIATPSQAMRLIEGYRNGLLTLVLRASGDASANGEPPINSEDLLGGQR